MKALNVSTTMSRETKSMLEPLLIPDYMSSDESVYLSDDEEEMTPASKKLVKRRAAWRSEEFQGYLDSLDRKLDRRLSERAKRMRLPQEVGEDSERHAPPSCPPWAKTVFD